MNEEHARKNRHSRGCNAPKFTKICKLMGTFNVTVICQYRRPTGIKRTIKMKRAS